MDDRQQQIKEGAGLEESRVNQELIDFLQKWSTPFFLLILVVAAGWWFLRYQEQQRQIRVAEAFETFTVSAESADTPSPGTLRAIAEDYPDVGSVRELSLLRLADLNLEAARTGLAIGATPQQDGSGYADEDILSAEDKSFYLDEARRAYAEAFDAASSDDDKAILAINAAFGLAAVAESQGDREQATRQYETAKSLAVEHGLTGLDTIADERLASLDALGDAPTFFTVEQLPRMPWDPEPQSETQPEPEPQVETNTEAGPPLPDIPDTPQPDPPADEPESTGDPANGDPADGQPSPPDSDAPESPTASDG